MQFHVFIHNCKDNYAVYNYTVVLFRCSYDNVTHTYFWDMMKQFYRIFKRFSAGDCLFLEVIFNSASIFIQNGTLGSQFSKVSGGDCLFFSKHKNEKVTVSSYST